MRVWGVRGTSVFALLLAACSFDATGEGIGGDTDAETESTTGTGGGPSTLTSPGGTSDSGSGSATTSTTTSTSTTTTTSTSTFTSTFTGTGDETGDETEGERGIGCPEPLPEGWIFCEDFEEELDPSRYDPFVGDGGSLVTADGEGLEGSSALRLSWGAFDNFAGTLRVRFGDAVATNVHASDESFDEVWVRMYTRTQDPWPGNGYGELISLDSLDEQDALAVVTRTWAEESQEQMVIEARTCISNGQVLCDGSPNDWQTHQILWQQSGRTPLTSADLAPQWHCVLLHTRLNTPGSSDGLFEVYFDGRLELARDDLDLRGDWTDFGLNAVRLSSFWQGGAPEERVRYDDDLVVSSVPLSCP